MYRFVLILVCFIIGCQPLSLPTETNNPAPDEDNILKPILLEPGKTREIQFLKGQLARQVLQLPELIEGQFYIINLVALSYSSEALIQPARNNDTGFSLRYSQHNAESDVPIMIERYSDEKMRRCVYIAFKAYQFPRAYLSMFYNFDDYTRNTDVILKVSLTTSRIDEQEVNPPDSLKPETLYTGIFTEKNFEESDQLYLTDFEDNSWYKLIVKADLSQSLFPKLTDQNFYTSMPYGYDDIVFTNSNTHIYYFKPYANSNPCSIRISGHIGVAYTLNLQKAPNSITSDSYEPDNGPISPNIECITGNDAPSHSHSFITSDESDWIQFTPTETGFYNIDLIIENSFIEPGLKLKHIPLMDIEIIQPDGATVEYYHRQELTIENEFPVSLKNIINWQIIADQLSPWFIHIRYKNNGKNPLPIEYSIRIHSEAN